MNGEDNQSIEPYKIFFQVKTKEIKADSLVPSDWTIYNLNILTIRKWILNNELTVFVICNMKDGKEEFKYSIPEYDFSYKEIQLEIIKEGITDNSSKKVKEIKQITCKHELTGEVIHQLNWLARIRHYDRLLRLTHPLLDISTEKTLYDFSNLEFTNFFTDELLCKLGFLQSKFIDKTSDFDVFKSRNSIILKELIIEAIKTSLIYDKENMMTINKLNIKVDLSAEEYREDNEYLPYNMYFHLRLQDMLTKKLQEKLPEYGNNIAFRYKFIIFQCTTRLVRLVLLELDIFRKQRSHFSKYSDLLINYLILNELDKKEFNKEKLDLICNTLSKILTINESMFNDAIECIRKRLSSNDDFKLELSLYGTSDGEDSLEKNKYQMLDYLISNYLELIKRQEISLTENLENDFYVKINFNRIQIENDINEYVEKFIADYS